MHISNGDFDENLNLLLDVCQYITIKGLIANTEEYKVLPIDGLTIDSIVIYYTDRGAESPVQTITSTDESIWSSNLAVSIPIDIKKYVVESDTEDIRLTVETDGEYGDVTFNVNDINYYVNRYDDIWCMKTLSERRRFSYQRISMMVYNI